MLIQISMGFVSKTILGFLFLAFLSLPIQAQETLDKKIPSETRNPPVSALNASASKLKENLGYKIDPNTQIGLGGNGGFKFGFKINF